MKSFFTILCLWFSFTSVVSEFFGKVWKNAVRQTLYEQDVEDVNSVHKIDNHLVRRLIVMPLSDDFNPNQADAMHGKIQYGDRCSLPSSLGRLIFEKKFEVPWLFEMTPVKSNTDSNVTSITFDTQEKKFDFENEDNSENDIKEYISNISKNKVKKIYVSPLDFRSPENYIFLPRWIMHDLGLKANDLVDISFVRIKLANLVVFQPLSTNWDDLLKEYSDPKVLLEHEINKYSSLTAKSTIYIEIKGIEYPLYVKETFAEGDISVNAVRVMDSDVKTDIDRKIIDQLIKSNKKKEKK
jgi:hypothetical protein